MHMSRLCSTPLTVNPPCLPSVLKKLRVALSEAGSRRGSSPDTRHWYISSLRSAILSKAQEKLLDKVLGPRQIGPANRPRQASICVCWWLPRLGTISPWSTKATDIAQHCGLSGCATHRARVVFYLTGKNGRQPGRAELAAGAAAVA